MNNMVDLIHSRFSGTFKVFIWPTTVCHAGPLMADSVEKVGFSARLNSDTTTPEEPTHHIEWFFGPSVTFAALLLG
jgi:hypothetical protein